MISFHIDIKERDKMTEMSNLTFKTYQVLLGLELSTDLCVERKIDKDHSLYIQVSDEGDAVYVSINKIINDEIENIHRVNSSLSVEDNCFIFYITKDLFTFKTTDSDINLDAEEIQKLDAIVKAVHQHTKSTFKKSLLKLSKLSVEDRKPRFVWLNTMEGFSNTFEKGEHGFNDLNEFLLDLSDDSPLKDSNNWKLIEYKCHTDHNFVFNKNMKLK